VRSGRALVIAEHRAARKGVISGFARLVWDGCAVGVVVLGTRAGLRTHRGHGAPAGVVRSVGGVNFKIN